MGSAGESGSSSSLVETALQAKATALSANDLRQPEPYRHATKQHLWTISKLQSELKSPRWHQATVLYTVMVLTLYDVCSAQSRVAYLRPDIL